MFMLAIDTSGADCAVGIFDLNSDRLAGAVSETIGKGHAERLMSMVDEALNEAGRLITDITHVAVTVGPGSFTGIRVGVAAARGFALALGCPAIGVSTLEVIAHRAIAVHPGHPKIMAAMDAKRGEIYIQMFNADGQPMAEPLAVSPEDALLTYRHSSAFLAGSGCLPMFDGTAWDDRFPLDIICQIAAARLDTKEKPTPLYIRGPDAKPQTGFAVARS